MTVPALVDSPDGGRYAVVVYRPDGADPAARMRDDLRRAVASRLARDGVGILDRFAVADHIVTDWLGRSSAVEVVALAEATLAGYLRLATRRW